MMLVAHWYEHRGAVGHDLAVAVAPLGFDGADRALPDPLAMKPVAFDPGWLRHRVVIEAPRPTPDGAGGETVTWAPLATVWALIEPVAGDRADRRRSSHRRRHPRRDDPLARRRHRRHAGPLSRPRRTGCWSPTTPTSGGATSSLEDGAGDAMSALDLTRSDLIRALGATVAARPAVDAAVRARAEAIAARVAAAGVEARVVRRGQADYAVEATGRVFARNSGATPGEPWSRRRWRRSGFGFEPPPAHSRAIGRLRARQAQSRSPRGGDEREGLPRPS